MLVWPNPNWSDMRSVIQWYFPLQSKWVFSGLAHSVAYVFSFLLHSSKIILKNETLRTASNQQKKSCSDLIRPLHHWANPWPHKPMRMRSCWLWQPHSLIIVSELIFANIRPARWSVTALTGRRSSSLAPSPNGTFRSCSRSAAKWVRSGIALTVRSSKSLTTPSTPSYLSMTFQWGR